MILQLVNDAPAASSGPPSAVVVAGVEETRVLLRGLLRLHGYRILGEGDGAARAVELLARQRPDLLLLDANLVEGTSADLITRVRQEYPGMRLVLVRPSGHASDAAPAARNPSPDVTLTRPFRIAEFAAAIRPSEDSH